MSTSTTDPTTTTNPPPWHASFPAPVSEPNWVPQSTLLTWLSADPTSATSSTQTAPQTLPLTPQTPGKDFILVDLRRTDHQGGTIRGSINLPAQSLWYSLGVLYLIVQRTEGKRAVFYCGSSTGRGSRAARWLQDYANSVSPGAPQITSYALEGGIRGWANAGKEHVALIDGYDEQYWKEGGKCAQ